MWHHYTLALHVFFLTPTHAKSPWIYCCIAWHDVPNEPRRTFLCHLLSFWKNDKLFSLSCKWLPFWPGGTLMEGSPTACPWDQRFPPDIAVHGIPICWRGGLCPATTTVSCHCSWGPLQNSFARIDPQIIVSYIHSDLWQRLICVDHSPWDLGG